jgi:hypothetical protein
MGRVPETCVRRDCYSCRVMGPALFSYALNDSAATLIQEPSTKIDGGCEHVAEIFEGRTKYEGVTLERIISIGMPKN